MVGKDGMLTIDESLKLDDVFQGYLLQSKELIFDQENPIQAKKQNRALRRAKLKK